MTSQLPVRVDPAPPPARSWRAAAWANRGWLIGGAAVAALAASAGFNLANTRRAEAEHPPAGRFVEVDGVRLHYVDRGLGRPVVLLHGNGVTWHDWEASGVVDRAVMGHRVIAFDRPGFGYSSRPRHTVWTPRAQAALIARALAELGVADALVVGHSWGALVALAMAVDHPEIAAGLVLMSGYYYPTARPDVLPMAAPAVPGLGDVLAHTVSPLSGAAMGPLIIKASFAPAPVSKKFARFPLALALRPRQVRATAADAVLMVPAAAELSRHYAELDLPVAIMAGKGDRIADVATHAERLAADILDSELRIVPELGHLFHYDATDAVVAAIDAVAARVTGRNG